MYKTVRHGENSLQYTILPQQDEAGGGGVGVGAGGGRGRGWLCGRRRKRVPALLALALLLAAGATFAGIFLPLLATGRLAEALPAALRRLAAASHAKMKMNADLHRNANMTSAVVTTETGVGVTNQSASAEYEDLTTAEPSTTVPTTTEPPTTTVTEAPTTEATTSAAPTTEEAPPPPPPPPPVATRLPSPAPTAAPVTAAAAAAVARQWDRPVTAATPRPDSWLGPRWSLGDPSAYLQWTGFRGRDSLLLPMLLLAALAAIAILAAGACIIMRRRRASQLRRQAIGEMSSDLQNEDKSTLLLPDGSEED